MAEYPDIQRKVAMEIEKVIGHERLVTLEDRGQLPYTEATMMEVLRFSSIVPLGVPHSTTCDVMLGNNTDHSLLSYVVCKHKQIKLPELSDSGTLKTLMRHTL